MLPLKTKAAGSAECWQHFCSCGRFCSTCLRLHLHTEARCEAPGDRRLSHLARATRCRAPGSSLMFVAHVYCFKRDSYLKTEMESGQHRTTEANGVLRWSFKAEEEEASPSARSHRGCIDQQTHSGGDIQRQLPGQISDLHPVYFRMWRRRPESDPSICPFTPFTLSHYRSDQRRLSQRERKIRTGSFSISSLR